MRSQGSNILPRAPHSGGHSSTGPLPPHLPRAGAMQVDPPWRLLALWAGWVTRPLQALILLCPSRPWNSGWKRSPEWPAAHASC